MKTKTLCFVCFTLMLALSISMSAQSPCQSLTGVWIYELDGEEGMNLITPTYAIWILKSKDRKTFKTAVPAEEEKAAAFTALNASAGKWTCDGKRATITHLFNKNPAFAGTSFDFEYEIKGNLCQYWIIQPDGGRGPMGKSWKVADWDGTTDCSGLTGVWEHLDQEGLYIQSGNYAAWITVDKNQSAMASDLSSIPGKGKAFDAVSAGYSISTCRAGGKTDHILYSSDPLMERQILSSDLEWTSNVLTGWMLDPDGKRMGAGIRMARVNTGEAKYAFPGQSFQSRHINVLNQMMYAYATALSMAKERGISAGELGRQLGEIYKHTWNKEAGAEGYIRGMLGHVVNFSTEPKAAEILSQSDGGVEYKWKADWGGFFNNGGKFGISLEEYDVFIHSMMQPISSHLGAAYEHKRLDDGWLSVSIRKK